MIMQCRIDVRVCGTPPVKASGGAAGWDLFSADTYVLEQNKVVLVATGSHLIIPYGYEGQIRPRSSLGKLGILIPNAPGTIDSDYRGEIKVMMLNTWHEPYTIEKGSRIAQIVFGPVTPVHMFSISRSKFDEDVTSRGSGGFGSTGI
jgi:dUTP pyrophosphatase